MNENGARRRNDRQALVLVLLLLQAIVLGLQGWALQKIVQLSERVSVIEAHHEDIAKQKGGR